MLKVLVADDERIARDIICLLLQSQSDITEVLQAKDGVQAYEIAQTMHPDIVFLDIQMPGLTGIQLAEKLSPDTVVVFVTAYDRYAVDAFELNAIDYLLKPFEDKRFYKTLDRVRAQLANNNKTDYANLGEFIQQIQDEQFVEYKSRLAIKEPGKIRLLKVNDINFISGAGNYAEIHLFDESIVLHRETLTSLEKQLDPAVFSRIHRSTIVRKSTICELKPTAKGDYEVLLKSGQTLTLSRKNKGKLADLLA